MEEILCDKCGKFLGVQKLSMCKITAYCRRCAEKLYNIKTDGLGIIK